MATLRRRIARAIRGLLGGEAGGHGNPADLVHEGVADAIVGAGESLANWWLEHPGVPREEVVDWFVALVDAAATTAARARLPATR